nr:tetratricopeptide repeat protein [Wenzhouxiangella sp. XN201]
MRVEPKVFDLLLYMVRYQGRAIAQDELLEQVWGRTVASDAVVSQAIHKLRSLLRDPGDLPDALTTLRGVGYRLDAPVTPTHDPGHPLARFPIANWRIALPMLLLVAGLVVWWQVWQTASSLPPRIALLPFENATGRAELDWIGAGGAAVMSEQLRRRGIDVVSPGQLDQVEQAAGEAVDTVTAAARRAGIEQVYAPRLVSDPDGLRLVLVNLTDQSTPPLELAGTGPASMSLAMAGMLAERLDAPLRSPAGALGLGNPFLDEAYARAYYHRQKGELDEAQELYEYILREAPDAHWARYHLSITLRYAGDMEASREQLQTLFEVALDDPWLAAAIRSTLGNMEWYAGNLNRAESLYNEARERFESHGMIGGVASALGNLGMVAFSRADFDRGRDYALQALAIYRRQGNRIQEARVMHNIGNSHFDQGNHEVALDYLEGAHGIRLELGLPDQAANTRTIMAQIALDQGRLGEGERMLEQILAAFRETGNERGIGRTLAHLAQVASYRGRYDRSRELALEALTLARSRNEAASTARAALLLGRALHARGDFQGAANHYEQAEKTWARLENAPGRITCLVERIRLALDRGEPEHARALLRQLEPLAADHGDRGYLESLQALHLRVRISSNELDDITPVIGELTDALDPGLLEHAELIIEVAEALHLADGAHPALARLAPAAERWAMRYFPAARHLYRTATDPEDCRRATRALQQLRGPNWRQSLPPSPACETTQTPPTRQS